MTKTDKQGERVNKIYEYGTGDVIPEGAIYLSTQVQTFEGGGRYNGQCYYVWHYFLVEVPPNP